MVLPAARSLSLAASMMRTASRSVQKASPSRHLHQHHLFSSPPLPSCSSLSRTQKSSRGSSSRTSSNVQYRQQQSRNFQTSQRIQHGGIERPEPGTGIKVTFRDSKGEDLKTVEVNEGDDLLSIAHEYDIELEGACEGSIACSTCHVILDPAIYDKLEEPGDDENDMLDLAFGLTDTSRLGCQVKVTKELDGMVAQLPSATRNMYVDGAKGGHGH